MTNRHESLETGEAVPTKIERLNEKARRIYEITGYPREDIGALDAVISPLHQDFFNQPYISDFNAREAESGLRKAQELLQAIEEHFDETTLKDELQRALRKHPGLGEKSEEIESDLNEIRGFIQRKAQEVAEAKAKLESQRQCNAQFSKLDAGISDKGSVFTSSINLLNQADKNIRGFREQIAKRVLSFSGPNKTEFVDGLHEKATLAQYEATFRNEERSLHKRVKELKAVRDRIVGKNPDEAEKRKAAADEAISILESKISEIYDMQDIVIGKKKDAEGALAAQAEQAGKIPASVADVEALIRGRNQVKAARSIEAAVDSARRHGEEYGRMVDEKGGILSPEESRKSYDALLEDERQLSTWLDSIQVLKGQASSEVLESKIAMAESFVSKKMDETQAIMGMIGDQAEFKHADRAPKSADRAEAPAYKDFVYGEARDQENAERRFAMEEELIKTILHGMGGLCSKAIENSKAIEGAFQAAAARKGVLDKQKKSMDYIVADEGVRYQLPEDLRAALAKAAEDIRIPLVFGRGKALGLQQEYIDLASKLEKLTAQKSAIEDGFLALADSVRSRISEIEKIQTKDHRVADLKKYSSDGSELAYLLLDPENRFGQEHYRKSFAADTQAKRQGIPTSDRTLIYNSYMGKVRG